MRSSRRQRYLAPEASATMENVGSRVSNSNSASDARPSPSPLAQVGAAISTVPQWATVEMAAPTWARVRARAGPHLTCVRAHIQVGAALSRNP